MPETKCITPGIAFGPVKLPAFYWCDHTVPAGSFTQYLVAENILANFHFFSTGKLAFA
jgi:hypothetical protein